MTHLQLNYCMVKQELNVKPEMNGEINGNDPSCREIANRTNYKLT